MKNIGTKSFRLAWKLLSVNQRKKFILICFSFFSSSCLEYIALSSSIPFVTVLINPEYLTRSDYYKYIENYIGGVGNENLLLILGAILTLLLLFSLIVNLTVTYVSGMFSAEVSHDLSKKMMKKCLNMPYTWQCDQDIPILAQRINSDPRAIGNSFFPALMELFYTLFIVVLGVVITFLISPWQSLMVILGITLLAILLILFTKNKVHKFSRVMRESSMYSNRYALYSLSSSKDSLIHGRQIFFINRYLNEFRTMLISKVKHTLISKFVPLILLITAQAGLIIIAMSLYYSGMNTAEIASYMAFLFLIFSRVFPGVTKTTGIIHNIVSILPSLDALFELQNDFQMHKKNTNFNNGKNVPRDWSNVNLCNTSFKYHGNDYDSLKNISINIEKGKFYGVVGYSGAGKSTLIDIILGLIEPDSGTILIDDKLLSEYSMKSWHENIGYVPQDPFVGNESVKWNVTFGIPETKINHQRVMDVLKTAGLYDFVKSLPHGLDTIIGERGAKFSGGQSQRLAIARALYNNPKLLILDEATSALDSITENEIYDNLINIENVTIISIAHRLSTISNSDKIFILKDACLINEGTYEQLMDDPYFSKLSDPNNSYTSTSN